jgi:MarR family transcriptional regulator, organic hydroperoxide resistance regulator
MTPTPARQALDLGPVVEFLQVVWALDRTLGVTGTQRFVLCLAAQRPGISAGALAAALHLHPSTLTGVLDRLTRRRLLERLPDASDARRALFRVTDAGRALADRRDGSVEACARRALRRVSPEDVRATERVLSALVAALDEGDR